MPPGQLATSSIRPADVHVHLTNFEQSVRCGTIEPPASQPRYTDVTVAALVVVVVGGAAVVVVGGGVVVVVVVVAGMIYCLQTTFDGQSQILMSGLNKVPLGHCESVGTISPLTLSHL